MTVLYENDLYQVIVVGNAIGEDGEYGRAGYAVENKETTIIEHTTMVLPQAIFQCQHLAEMVKSLTEEPVPRVDVAELPVLN
jgi:hypothetical protein